MKKNINGFLEQTLKALDISKDDPQLAVRGFEFELSETNKECILVIGINPAGDANTAEFEKITRTYLYSLNTKVEVTPYVYNKYYKPIYDLINETCENDVKWHWCNKNYEDLEEGLNNSELKEIANDILQEYNEHEDRKYTIFIGDMFYYMKRIQLTYLLKKIFLLVSIVKICLIFILKHLKKWYENKIYLCK